MSGQLFIYYLEKPLVIISINSESWEGVMVIRLDIENWVIGKGALKGGWGTSMRAVGFCGPSVFVWISIVVEGGCVRDCRGLKCVQLVQWSVHSVGSHKHPWSKLVKKNGILLFSAQCGIKRFSTGEGSRMWQSLILVDELSSACWERKRGGAGDFFPGAGHIFLDVPCRIFPALTWN
jgi:hypothetical protein